MEVLKDSSLKRLSGKLKFAMGKLYYNHELVSHVLTV